MARQRKNRVTGALLKRIHHSRAEEIHSRLKEFERLWRVASERTLFKELAFCLLTPGTRARNAEERVNELDRKGLLWKGSEMNIAQALHRKIRFHNNKARFLVGARELLLGRIRQVISQFGENKTAREWLVANVKGLGWKEASHFLRNIGRGKGLAIVDTHILKNLRGLGLVERGFYPSSRKRYLAAEEKVLRLAKKLRIPAEELDLVIWSKETGEVFK